MKKLLLIPALLGSMAIAQDYKYEITPVVGYNIAEGNLNLDNQFLVGAEFQYNDCDSLLKPELSILYTDSDYENSNISTDIYRIAVNGVHEYDAIGNIIPLAKVGVGYETMDRHLFENKESIFFDVGAGAKIPFTDSIALKLEAIYMLKNNDNRWDSNLAMLAGINFAFGPKSQSVPVPVDGDDDNDGVLNPIDQCPTTPTGTTVDAKGCKVDGDDDNDGVLNSIDQCPTTPTGTTVDAKGCKVDGDDDNDGVLNSIDQCPTTPTGNLVDRDGCTKIVNLHVNFENNSYVVDEASKLRVKKFANFLTTRSNFTAQIIGHTNSIGRELDNQILSENRANAVRDLIIEYGIEAHRVTAIGKGESTPVASNDTAEGLAQNRRIEASLNKN
ncbi:MAG: OmpA family protein [Sulfurimonas sp.]|nr:OmpA family protein [Sulfurimonas sp.]